MYHLVNSIEKHLSIRYSGYVQRYTELQDIRKGGRNVATNRMGPPLNIRLTDEQHARLDELAQATRRNKSEVVRLLIDAATTDGRPDVWLDPNKVEGLGAVAHG